ncbi:hypothetical protein HPP92_003051 [Vanilla planifolia]|uniref:Uncharacterized protein n=1 Tax=Vanilla planifolia TaxID=51239 RepID=A0A835S115_VANPL|nr:hypothetical protein HPP92_003051 [Vanilla planifolia]
MQENPGTAPALLASLTAGEGAATACRMETGTDGPLSSKERSAMKQTAAVRMRSFFHLFSQRLSGGVGKQLVAEGFITALILKEPDDGRNKDAKRSKPKNWAGKGRLAWLSYPW